MKIPIIETKLRVAFFAEEETFASKVFPFSNEETLKNVHKMPYSHATHSRATLPSIHS